MAEDQREKVSLEDPQVPAYYIASKTMKLLPVNQVDWDHLRDGISDLHKASDWRVRLMDMGSATLASAAIAAWTVDDCDRAAAVLAALVLVGAIGLFCAAQHARSAARSGWLDAHKFMGLCESKWYARKRVAQSVSTGQPEGDEEEDFGRTNDAGSN